MYQRLTQQERIAARFIPSGYTEYKRSGDSVIYASPNHLSAIAYRGKSAKCDWFYTFTTENGFLSAVTRFFEKIDALEKWSNERKEERKNFVTALKPGDILYTSWGYDQTNVEFYQVIEVKNNTIKIQEICADYVSTQAMAGYVTPILNKPCKVSIWHDDINGPNGRSSTQVDAPILTKRVQGCKDHEYVKIDESSDAWIWDGQKKYTSSYA